MLEKLISISLTCLVILGCSKETVIKDNYVVEGFLVAGESVNNIKVKGLSKIGTDSVISPVISDARVTLSNDGNSYLLEYNPSTDLYEYVGDELAVSINSIYELEVDANGRNAISSTIVPEVPTGLALPRTTLEVPQLTLNFDLSDEIRELFLEERITLEWDARSGESFFVVIESTSEEIDPILPEGIPEDAIDFLSSFRFISEPSEETTFDIIAVALESYGPHVAKVYSVNQEYVDLFENREQDSRNLNEPPSNIDNALGIFTAFAVDSIEFEVIR